MIVNQWHAYFRDKAHPRRIIVWERRSFRWYGLVPHGSDLDPQQVLTFHAALPVESGDAKLGPLQSLLYTYRPAVKPPPAPSMRRGLRRHGSVDAAEHHYSDSD